MFVLRVSLFNVFETLSSSSPIGLLALSMFGVAAVCLLFFLSCLLLLCCDPSINRLHILREPADTLTVALAHDDRAHEDLNGADALEGDLALASCNKHEISTELLLKSITQQNNLLVW